jgi:hypothetical protein
MRLVVERRIAMCLRRLTCMLLVIVVAGLVAAQAQEPDPAMLGWWKLDEGPGDVATDSSGRGNHGTIYNLTAGLGAGGDVWVQDAERGTVLSFNGDTTGAYVRAGEIPRMTLENDFAWAFWARQDWPAGGVCAPGGRYWPPDRGLQEEGGVAMPRWWMYLQFLASSIKLV